MQLISERVEQPRVDADDKVICRLASGWAVIGDVQFLAGHGLLLPDPVVTKLVKCVDVVRSEKDETGAVELEVFHDINVPREAAVFNDPVTAKVRIYTHDPGKKLIEELVAEAGLTGIECGSPRRY